MNKYTPGATQLKSEKAEMAWVDKLTIRQQCVLVATKAMMSSEVEGISPSPILSIGQATLRAVCNSQYKRNMNMLERVQTQR